MADQKPDDEELDENGNPIKAPEDDKASSKIEPDESDTGDDAENPDDIPVRKSALQHIIARKNRTIDRLRSKGDGDADEQPDREAGDDDDKELTLEARGAVQAEVARQIGPVMKTLASSADEGELQDLLADEPDAAKYEKRIRSYMGNPHYQGVPPSVIFHHLAFGEAESSGARRKKAADTDAGQSRGGGNAKRPIEHSDGIPTAEELDEMSDEEFEALQNRARSGEFVKPQE